MTSGHRRTAATWGEFRSRPGEAGEARAREYRHWLSQRGPPPVRHDVVVPRLTPRPTPRSTPPPWLIYLSVFAGGMLGGTTRYLVGLAVPPEPGSIPWGIFMINILGAFVLSVLLAGWARRGHKAHPWRPFLATGVLGSFTTWSTFMTDTYALAHGGVPGLAAFYVVLATTLGIAAAGLGWWVAQRVVPEADPT